MEKRSSTVFTRRVNELANQFNLKFQKTLRNTKSRWGELLIHTIISAYIITLNGVPRQLIDYVFQLTHTIIKIIVMFFGKRKKKPRKNSKQ